MVHRQLVYMYLLGVPSVFSRYFNKIKRTYFREIARLIARNSYVYLSPYLAKSGTLMKYRPNVALHLGLHCLLKVPVYRFLEC